jgi:ligand-binding SRPBCC domain-containing protein
MKKLVCEQWLPISLDEAWDFFSSPKNLNEITPENMVFEIKSDIPEKMYPGMFIMYNVRPVMNIPMKWVTEITHVEHRKFFVDEQRIGPYHIWHHEHHFEEKDGGVLMTDILHYNVGKSFLGWIASKLFVDKKVKGIFDYRFEILKKKFGSNSKN